MRTTSNVGQAVGAPHAQAAAPAQAAQANLGAHAAQPGHGQTINRRIGDFFRGIRDHFRAIPGRVRAHQAKTKFVANTKAAEGAARQVLNTLGKKHDDVKMASLMPKLIAKAAKLDAHDPVGKAFSLLNAEVAALPADRKAAFEAAKWSSMGPVTDAVIDHTMGRGQAVQQGLADMGMGNPDDVATDQDIADTKANVNALLGALADQKAAKLQTKLPAGVTVDRSGNITGGSTIRRIANDASIRGGQALRGRSFQDEFAGCDSKLDNLVPCGDLTITSQAASDFYRLDYEFEMPDGTVFRSMDIDSDDQGTRNRTVARALADLTGDETAMTTLSAVLVQDLANALQFAPQKADESEVKFKVCSAMNTAGRTMTLKDGTGTATPVDSRASGATKYRVSIDDNGDYRIRLTMPAYVEAYPGLEADLPLHKDGVIGMTVSTEIFVNRSQARVGNLDLVVPNGVTVAYSGRLDV